MIITLPVCAKDEALAIANLEWCLKIDGQVSFRCIVSHDTSFDASAVLSLARRYFTNVEGFVYDKWTGESKWPYPQNWAWQSTARHLAKQKEAWLWWEADAVPLRAGWLQTLQEGYEEAKKSFMGCVMYELDGHLNGVAIYPANIHDYTSRGLICRAAPFDVVMGPEIHKFTAHTSLIQHIITDHGSCFPNSESVSLTVNDEAVLFHRCKDGSLIERLKENKSWLRHVPALFKPKPKTGKIIPIIAHLDSSSGYGIFSSQMALELLKLDYQIEVYPPSFNEIHGALAPELKACIRRNQNQREWDLVIFPCVIQPSNLVLGAGRHAYFSMWESTRLVSAINPKRMQAVSVMNQCQLIIVPNAWNASCFNACGVNRPIRIVPLGADMQVFEIAANNVDGPLTFGTAAKTAGGGVRKGFSVVVEAFRLAFPKTNDVRLKVKTFSEDPPIDTHQDSRIEVVQNYIGVPELVDWYKSINVFVSGSAAEGWGKHQHESMCMGRPVIGVNYGGVCEFFSCENGYAVDFKLVPAEGIYETMGVYAKPDLQSMAEQMLRAYQDRAELKWKIALASASARRFTLADSAQKLLTVLREFQFPV